MCFPVYWFQVAHCLKGLPLDPVNTAWSLCPRLPPWVPWFPQSFWLGDLCSQASPCARAVDNGDNGSPITNLNQQNRNMGGILGCSFRQYQRIGWKTFLHHGEQAELACKIRTFVVGDQENWLVKSGSDPHIVGLQGYHKISGFWSLLLNS